MSSFVAGYLAKNVDEFIYIDISNQHPDSMRFIRDCERVLKKPVTILRSDRFGSVQEVLRKYRFINSPHGAPCTGMLKKAVRKKWEGEHAGEPLTYVWGMDRNETARANRIRETMIEQDHEFPLIDNNLSKAEAHGLLDRIGIRRPLMYDLGYSNNNCIGCVKGGMAYWNKIRVDFPEVFAEMAQLEREIGHTCIKGVYLDELSPDAGRGQKPIVEDCGIMCELALLNK